MVDPEQLSLDELRSVVRAAYRGSSPQRRPADRPHLDPAVVAATRHAERLLGTPIFAVPPEAVDEVGLTPAGSAFCASAIEVLDRFDQAIAQARAIDRDSRAPEPQRTVRVGVLVPAGAELTHPILSAFASGCPTVSLTLTDLSRWGGETALLRGDVDVAFLWTPVSRDKLDLVTLFEDSLVALLPSRHPLATRASLHPSDLAEERFTSSVTMSSEWRRASMLRPWRERPENAVDVLGPLDALEAIRAGRAASVGPASLGRINPPSGLAAVPLRVIGGPSAVVCALKSDVRELTRTFLEVSREVARRVGPLVLPPQRAGPLAEERTQAPPAAPLETALSSREHEVLIALSSGWTAHHIAHALGISTATVRKHLEHVYTKLDAHDRVSVVNRARELGLLPH